MEMTAVGVILVLCMLLMLTSGIWVALTLTGLAVIGLTLIENSSIGLLLGTSPRFPGPRRPPPPPSAA